MSEATPQVTIRQATPADRDAIVALCHEVFDAFDAAGVALILADERYGTDAFWVGDDGEQVVACLGLLSMDLYAGEVALQTGQPEYVAVAEPYRRRGLVRQMMALAHDRSESRGDVLQMIGGIPYYYRRFGYGWGVAMPGCWRPRDNDVPTDDGATVRDVTHDDVARVAALDAGLRRRADLFNTRTPAEWQAMLDLRVDGQHFWAVERDGAVSAYGACHVSEKGFARLSDVTAADIADVHVLVRHALEAGRHDVMVIDRPRTVVEPWGRSFGVRAADAIYAWFARIPDPVALLDRLRPVLTARLQDSPLATWSGEVPFTTYVDGFALHVERGEVTGVERREGDIDPGPDTVGVAPDQLPGLLFGRLDPLGLEDQQPDVRLRHHAGLCAILFPRQVAQVNLWF